MPPGPAMLILLLQAFWAALASPDPRGMQEWLPAAMEAEGLRLLRWGSVDLDGDGQPDAATAWLCDLRPIDEGGPTTPSRVFEADGRRWVVDRAHAGCRWPDRSHPTEIDFEQFEPRLAPLRSVPGASVRAICCRTTPALSAC